MDRKRTDLRKALLALSLAALAVLAACSIPQGLPPSVSYTAPSDGTGNVPFAGTISATFSRPMDPSTITTASFTVQMGDIPVTGTVSYSGKTATFTPSSLLPGNTWFTATITTAVKDTAGTPMAAPRQWTFMTVPLSTAASIVLYYTYTFGAPFTRSSTPVSLTAGGDSLSQSFNPTDGSITLTMTSTAAYEDNGFYFYVGTLQNFNSLKVVAAPGSGSFTANLYLDVDGNGEFFVWSPPNVYFGLGADQYGIGPASAANLLTIDTTTTFSFGVTPYTMAQLKSGAMAGVGPATRVAIWLGSSVGPGTWTTTLDTIKVN